MISLMSFFDNAVRKATRMDLDGLQSRYLVELTVAVEKFPFSDARLLHWVQFYEAVNTCISTIDWHLHEKSMQLASRLNSFL